MNPRAFGDNLVLAVRQYLQQNNLISLGQINAVILADIAQQYYEHHQAQEKQRSKRGDATEEELSVYNLYPRKVARRDAIAAIRNAARKIPIAVLRERTALFGRCVGRWPEKYRYKDGRDLCPHPATWFNRESYLEDEKEWLPAGMFTREDDPKTNGQRMEVVNVMIEPAGWRDQFPGCIYPTWADMPQDSKLYVIGFMNKRKTT